VSVRTVQYYDSRDILTPSTLSEGGRRLYSEEDLGRMKAICFLREAGVSLGSIGSLLAEEHPECVIAVLLDEQERELRLELDEQQKKLELIQNIRRELKEMELFSVASIGDIAYVMKNKTKLRKLHWCMVLTGIPVTALQWTAIILWITHGFWWLFVLWVLVAVPWGIIVSKKYFESVAYICPACHTVFKPRFKEMFWAYHTPKMRRLTCTNCAHHGMCVEVYAGGEEKKND